MRTILLVLLLPSICYGQVMPMDVVAASLENHLPSFYVNTILRDDPRVSIVFTPNTSINGGGGIQSDRTAFGRFVRGKMPFGELLPAANRGGTNIYYSGGINLENGIVMATGKVDDQMGGAVANGALNGCRAEGPNNGKEFEPSPANPGEVSAALGKPNDSDFVMVTGLASGGDACVLRFTVRTTHPSVLRCILVHATDEFDGWLTTTFNDTTIVLVNNQNIVKFKKMVNGQLVESLMSLAELEACNLLMPNDLVPAPDSLDGSEHHNMTLQYYDHEYGAFTKKLGKDTTLLPPGDYSIEIIIQDVNDTIVDSAVFIPTDGIQFSVYGKADFNMDGIVDTIDYVIWRNNLNLSPATFSQGDASFNGTVGPEEYDIWRANFNLTGFAEFSADFDRSGGVTQDDYLIWQAHNVTPHCSGQIQRRCQRRCSCRHRRLQHLATAIRYGQSTERIINAACAARGRSANRRRNGHHGRNEAEGKERRQSSGYRDQGDLLTTNRRHG